MPGLIMLAILLGPAEEPITEVSLRRQPCYGRCPVDKVVLRSNGSAEYTGTLHVKLMGEYRGRVDAEDFRKLASLVAEKKFFDLQDRYRVPVTDQATLITGVKRGGTVKEVSNYAQAGPKELEEIEKRIVELMGKIEWTRAS